MNNKQVINFMQHELAINNIPLIIDNFNDFIENSDDDVTLHVDDFIDNKRVTIKIGLFAFNSVVISSRSFTCDFKSDSHSFKIRFKQVVMAMIEDMIND